MIQLNIFRHILQITTRHRVQMIALSLAMIALVGSIIYLSYVASRIPRDTRKLYVDEIKQLRYLSTSDPLKLADVLDHTVVIIGAGDFFMGSDEGHDDERPQHLVYLDTFEIDRYEITNIQYQRFIQETGRRVPQYWTGMRYPEGQADYPVAGVSWDDADAYCVWAGKRLPTEAEWEKACRGTDGRIYPWGNTWKTNSGNTDPMAGSFLSYRPTDYGTTLWDYAWIFLRETPSAQGARGLKPVGLYLEGASPYGIMDMVGNVSEWVADWYAFADYSKLPLRNPQTIEPHWNHALRGSTWYDPNGSPTWVQRQSRCSARNSSHDSRPDARVGFRCASSLP
jgi:formylglycine-generating enzyme required for sulfatase activity